MNTDLVLHKYMRQFRLMDGARFYHIDAVELAFRLALDELAESTPSTQSTELAALQADLERLQTDADTEIAALKAQLAQLDADNAAMIRRNGELISPLRTWIASAYPQHAIITDDERLSEVVAKLANEMRIEIVTLRQQIATLQADLERLQTAANAEVAELRQQIAQMDADNAAMIRRNRELVAALDIATVAILTNGATAPAQSAISNQQSPINNSMWSDPATLTTLDDIAKDWWIGVAAGRHIWRTVPKPIQLQLVRHILSFGPETGAMTMRDFDAIKPDWMPGSGSHTKTLNLSWSQLNDWSVEL